MRIWILKPSQTDGRPRGNSRIFSGSGGEAVGTALARLLWGDVNFSGKLAQTFPPADRVGPGHEEREYPGVNGDNIGDAFPVYYDEGTRFLEPFSSGCITYPNGVLMARMLLDRPQVCWSDIDGMMLRM